jgi:hypothetical protein
MKILTTLFVSALLSFNCIAQLPGITISETNQSFLGSAARPVYKMLILQAKKNDVIKALEKRLEKGTKQDAKVVDNTVKIEKVYYKNFWTDSLSIQAEIIEVEQGTVCYFAIDKDTATVSSKTHEELDVEVRKYMKRFGLNMYGDALVYEMKIEEKHLKSIEKELRSAQGESDKYRQKIDNKKVEVANKKEEIKMNDADRQAKMQEISAQKVALAAVDPAQTEKKALEKDKLKTLKKELKKNKKTDKKMRKEKFKLENQARDFELEKEKADKHIESVQGRIAEQTEVIEAVRKKQYAVQDAIKGLNL